MSQAVQKGAEVGGLPEHMTSIGNIPRVSSHLYHQPYSVNFHYRTDGHHYPPHLAWYPISQEGSGFGDTSGPAPLSSLHVKIAKELASKVAEDDGIMTSVSTSIIFFYTNGCVN